MFVVRWLVGRLILLLNLVFFIRSPKRDAEIQKNIDESTAHLSLYQLPACPFCVKVRRAIKREGLKIKLCNINQSEVYRKELTEQGGKHKVPCLKIAEPGKDVKWLYESKDIVKYLEQFSQ